MFHTGVLKSFKIIKDSCTLCFFFLTHTAGESHLDEAELEPLSHKASETRDAYREPLPSVCQERRSAVSAARLQMEQVKRWACG